MLSVLVVNTRTTQRKSIFRLAILADSFSLIASVFGFPVSVASIEDCEYGTSSFMMIFSVYSMFALVRLAVVLCHFMYGPRFWRWVKRIPCCQCLSAVEYEQRVDFDIYDAKDYVTKVNQNLRQTSAVS